MMILNKKKNKKLTVGIDLGTTYSLVATVEKGITNLLLDHKNRVLLPSIVHYQKNNILVGWDAQKKIIQDASNTISSVKRLIGRSIPFIKKYFSFLPYIITENIHGEIQFHTNYGKITAVDVSSHILQTLQKRAYLHFKKNIHATVITVPAYFNSLQRKETKKAAYIAKMNIVRLINEPTAAAIAYGLMNQKKGIIAVYDLGGGTFDISILQLKKGIFEVLATSGDANLGGDDFDFFLAEYIYKKSKINHKCNIFFQSLLLQTAKKVKLHLTKYYTVKIKFLSWIGEITRNEFNNLIQNYIDKTLFICEKIIKEINLNIHNIQEIIMVGGSTRIPLVYEKVTQFFRKRPLRTMNPDQVVAIGAAIHANMLFGDKLCNKTILLDVIPLSLGIEVIGGFFEKIIHSNTSIPISITKEFTTFKDWQTIILIHVLQGEKKLVKDCFSLSRFILKNLPPKKAGNIRISVNFQVDTEGLLSVTVLEKNSGIKKHIYIDDQFQWNQKKIDDYSEESNISIKSHYCLKIKEEKIIEANDILYILKKYLNKNKNLINKNEIAKIIDQKMKLQKSINQNDFFLIKNNLRKLEKVSRKIFLLNLQHTLYCYFIKLNLNENI